MKSKIKTPFPLLLIFLILTLGCNQGKDAGHKKAEQSKRQASQSPKITATKEDLARLIMRQTKIIHNDQVGRVTTDYIVSVLSDGSDFREICTLPNNEVVKWVNITKDLQHIVYIHQYPTGKRPHPLISANIVIWNLKADTKRHLFTEQDLEQDKLSHRPLQLDILKGRFYPYADKLTVNTSSNSLVIDIPSGNYKRIDHYRFPAPILLPSGNLFSTWIKEVGSQIYQNMPILYNIQQNKLTYTKKVKPGTIMDDFKVSADGKTFSYFAKKSPKHYLPEKNTHLNDTLRFYNENLDTLPALIRKSIDNNFTLGPKGEWLYYDHKYTPSSVEKNVLRAGIYRIPKTQIMSSETPDESYITTNGELVYVNPQADGEIFSTVLTQILPIN